MATAASYPPGGEDSNNDGGTSYNYSTAFEIHYRRNVVPDESLAIGHLLSRELLKLSLDDRTAIQEEIHGVRCMAIRETPELLQRGLEEFHTELEKIPKEQKRTYEECRVRAMLYRDEEDSCYALNDAFKLRFLRVELFDAAKAAHRFASYLEFVREFWGPEIALKRLIRFSDFTKAEMKLFRKGFFQVLPFRDHSGRRVLALLGGFDPEIDRVARSKALFYISDVLTRTDIESQQRGLVVIGEAYMWSSEESGRDKRSNSLLRFPHPQEGLYYTKRLLESMANRMIAIHSCWPDRPAFRIISKLLTIYGVSGSTQRLRLKFHIGDELEMRYRLKSYGIPIELLPITETGSIKMINHNYWIKTRKHIEQGIDNNVTIVECPGSNDVVFRQGTSSMENPGNVKCRDLILSLLEDRDVGLAKLHGKKYHSNYNSRSGNNSSVAAKIHNDLVERLVDQIECHRYGRFLEWDKHRSTWVQMLDRPKVKQKVSVLLHSIDKRYRKAAASNMGRGSGSGRSSMMGISSINDNKIRSDLIVSSDIVSSNSNIKSNTKTKSNSKSNDSRNIGSPSLFLHKNLDAMVIKSDDEAEPEVGGSNNNTNLGPYSFLEGGRSVLKQQQCCRLGNDVFPSQQMSRKRMKKV